MPWEVFGRGFVQSPHVVQHLPSYRGEVLAVPVVGACEVLAFPAPHSPRRMAEWKKWHGQAVHGVVPDVVVAIHEPANEQ